MNVEQFFWYEISTYVQSGNVLVYDTLVKMQHNGNAQNDNITRLATM